MAAPVTGPGMTGSHRLPRTAVRTAAILMLVGCATAGGFREQNRKNLEKLRVGMTRDQVLDLMGTGQFTVPVGTEAGAVRIGEDDKQVKRVEIPVGGKRPVFYNPVRSEVYQVAGHAWEALFYYTRLVTDDGDITDDEITPLVLEDGTLIGWGWPFWATEVEGNGIPATLPDFDTFPPEEVPSSSAPADSS